MGICAFLHVVIEVEPWLRYFALSTTSPRTIVSAEQPTPVINIGYLRTQFLMADVANMARNSHAWTATFRRLNTINLDDSGFLRRYTSPGNASESPTGNQIDHHEYIFNEVSRGVVE